MPHTLPYGAWTSPIGAALAASHDGRPEYAGFVGDEVWWTEPRPTEGGRRALVRRTAGSGAESVLPAPWNVRSRVIEYGGQPWAGAWREQGPLIVFVHFPDQRLYAFEPDTPGAEPVPLTPVSAVGGGLRWVDPRLRLGRGEVWCVLEEFTGEGPGDVRRVLAAVPLDGSAAEDRGAVRELSDGRHRFVTGARISPDGRSAVWLAWDHPRMPWDGTELLRAELDADGLPGAARTVAGGPDESIAQADWAPDGTLLYASDRSGWWNVYRADPHRGPVALCRRDEEFAGPLWKVGLRWFAPLDSGLIAVIHGKGATALGILDPETGQVVDAAGPWTEWSPTLTTRGSRAVGIAASPRSAYEVVELDTATGRARVIGAAHDDPVDPAYYPEPQIRTFAGPAGREVHAHIYPPHNPRHRAADDELPPYVIWAHGGPTARAPLVLDLEIAYFTSRGIGVAEVNYGGSAGYGRAYRDRLREQWGVVDVEDCVAVARALAEEGTADPERLAIRGGSAGGWTTAVSLAATDVYACGTILYPILDVAGWATGETHDFESQYPQSLVGPLTEAQARYEERSPTRQADRITAPFLLLQGLDDAICPPAQCERFLERFEGMAEEREQEQEQESDGVAGRGVPEHGRVPGPGGPGRGVPHAYIAFEGEGHGFRRADTMIRVLESELSLYAQVFGLRPPGIPQLELSK